MVRRWGNVPFAKPVTLGTIGMICLMALLAVDRGAFAQAGSTGGTIGKTDKSVSGGQEQSRQPQPAKKQTRRAAGPVLTGLWDWQCGNALSFPATGNLQLVEGSEGRLTGEFISDSGSFQGGKISGSVHGNSVSFVRDNGSYKANYSAVLEEPNRMIGSVAPFSLAPEGCRFTALKR
jgi:hypothetical protein